MGRASFNHSRMYLHNPQKNGRCRFHPPRFFSVAAEAFEPSHDQPASAGTSTSHELHGGRNLIFLIKSSTQKSHLLQIHSYLLRTSYFFDRFVFVSFLSRFGLHPLRDLSYAFRIFSVFPQPDVSLYNTMIKAYSLSHDSATKGLLFYRELLLSGIPANALSATVSLKCCRKLGSLFNGVQIHAMILKHGYNSDSVLLTTLLDFYSGLEMAGDACKLFDEITHRDTVTWNVLISCYTRNGRTRDALGLFYRMRNSVDCQPDSVTCLLVLQACASLNSLEFGEEVHRYIMEHNLDVEMNVSNSLIAMYSRCGCMDRAYQVFKKMTDKDEVTWSTMISGLANNGHGRDAIAAFQEMQRTGISPGDHSFTGVLSACSQSGLVDEGWMFFNSMSQDFGITPNVHHYGCMVDLLGRASLLDEAYNLIISMKIKPDPTIWRTLLGACRIHRHVALGEQVTRHLIELKAQEAGDYILLLNIYSSMGIWEKVAQVRKLMKDRGIQSTPSCSTIELKGKVHEFAADDVLHARKKEIYEMLEEINQQLRIAGYVAEITSEMHDMDAAEKKLALSFHSEKLAIAFGVLSTAPGTTLRVAKDLRICRDCHNFAKLLSAVYDRTVVIRDYNRFHHFQEGRCSCNDYW